MSLCSIFVCFFGEWGTIAPVQSRVDLYVLLFASKKRAPNGALSLAGDERGAYGASPAAPEGASEAGASVEVFSLAGSLAAAKAASVSASFSDILRS